MRAAAVGLVLLTAGVANAYTIQSPVSTGCHERITQEALRAVRANGLAAPLAATTDDDHALIADLPFDVPGDMNDWGSVSILFGVRRWDIRDNSDVDITALATVHGDPNRQDDHCLRAPTDDEPNGSLGAIATCQANARTSLEGAALGILEDGSVDPTARAKISTSLPLRSKVDVEVSQFYLNMGQALHTLQDGFSHTFRDDDATHITTVLNWVEWVEEEAKEERDGPDHRGELDDCINIDERQQRRLQLATDASVALITAMLTEDPAQRVDAAAAVFNNATGAATGCGFDNAWCSTVDNQYVTAACSQAGVSPWLLLSALGLVRFRRGVKWDWLLKRSS